MGRVREMGACLSLFALAHAHGISAQETQPQADSESEDASPSDRRQVYEPAYFDRFGPRDALDMLEQVPGFSISGDSGGQRGLGQASQNVLVNGERLSSKSESVSEQLARIPADKVVRIEIVDGTSLDIPGLSGQVANVVVLRSGLSGSFEWEGGFRTTGSDPEWYGGEISVAGASGALDYTVALSNDNSRQGPEGVSEIRDATGTLVEFQEIEQFQAFDKPTISANLGYDFGDEVTANLNLTYARVYFSQDRDENIVGPLVDPRLRAIRTFQDGYEYEIGADLTVPLGPGRLKLIGLERYDFEDTITTVVSEFVDPALASTGVRSRRIDDIGERIGRAEYNWPLWGADWQLSGEAAFNRLDRETRLFELEPDGAFAPIEFPEGTGGVREDRYEVALSFSRPISDRVSVQAVGGYEFSTLKQTGALANQRSFARPKGSLSLAWNNGDGLDAVVKLERRVGQLSFGDFLARVFLVDENENSGNSELVPEQRWEASIELNKSLGAWGFTTFELEQRWIEDFTDIVLLPNGGEGRGNIPSARRTEAEWNTTLKLDPMGIPGAQLDLRFEIEEGEIRDPVDGVLRTFSNARDREVDIDFRHDLPGTDVAYGGGVFYARKLPFFRTREIGLEDEGPTFVSVFVEHKDLAGLTARATVSNLAGGSVINRRQVFDGIRTTAPILFVEDKDLRIGPIFRFSISGNF